MTLMIVGAVMIFLATLLGVFLLVLSMPVIFNFITNEIFLEKLFLRFGKENFSFALIKLKNNLMSNLIIYVFFGILMILSFVLLTIVVSQIRHRKNHKVAIRLIYTNFVLTGTIFTVLILMIIFTGIWWFSFVLAVLAMGLLFLQNSFLSLIKNSINYKINRKEYQINNIVTDVARKINNEKFLDITNEEIANIKKNNIQSQQSLSLEKEQLHSEFFNDKEYENDDIDNNKLLVKSEESLPDILNPMLLKENEDDGYEISKIVKEPIYEEIATDEMLFNLQITAERIVVSNEQQQLDANTNVVALGQQKVDSQLQSYDSKQMDINENLQVEQPQCSYVAPRGDLQYNYVKQPLMSNSVQTGNGEYGSGKQLFANEYYQEQQYSQVQSQMLDSNNNVALGQQKVDSQLQSYDSKQMDINENLQVEQPQCSYVAPRGDLQYNYVKQPLMSNSVQTGNGEYGSGKQLFANEYYQEQQYSQVQSQMLDSNNNVALGQQKVDSQLQSYDSKQMDINENLQVEQPQCSYVAPRGDLQYNYVKQPLMSNSVQTGNEEYGSGKQLFANEYYQEQQYSQVQSQMLDSNNNVALGQQKVDSQLQSYDSKQMDINENLQVEQPQCSYVAPRGDLQYNYVKQPLMSNSVQTGNGEYGSGKQLFANEYYQEQQYSQVQSQMLDSNNNVALGQQKVDSQLQSYDSKQMDINENLQVEQPQCSYVAPRGDLQYNYVKQPLMSNSVQTGNGEYGSGKQLFANEYYQEQQYSQVQSQMLDSNNNVALGQQKVDSQLQSYDSKQMDINENLQVEQPQCSYVAPRGDLQYNYVKQPLMSNSVQTGNGEYGSRKQLFANESYQNLNLDVNIALNDSRNLFNQDNVVDTMIDPNKIYYHSPMTGKTIEINQQETQKFLFANLPGKPDELESPVYDEYNPIEEQDKKPKQDKKKNQESRSYGIFDQTMQRQTNTGIHETVSYPQGYVQARYQTKSNYYEQQPALNINLPKQETYNKSVVNQQFDSLSVAEHCHSQYPNYTFTNDSCPICYQGG